MSSELIETLALGTLALCAVFALDDLAGDRSADAGIAPIELKEPARQKRRLPDERP